MQRLTKRLPDGNAVMDCDNCGLKKYKQCTLYGCRNRLMKRLADYEDNDKEIFCTERSTNPDGI